MTERPILFSTPMVQAILDGRKTMTRRIVKKIEPESKFLPEFKFSGFTFIEPDQFEKPDSEKIASVISCRYGQPGDVLWVREKFACTLGKYEPETTYSYFADSFHWSFFPEDKSNGETSCQWHDPDLAKEVKWKPSIHMPKAAAMRWLQVEVIRVERLQDISEEDAALEGCYTRDGFEVIWVKINGQESWDANPWVWVIKFKYSPPPENQNPEPVTRRCLSAKQSKATRNN